MITAAFDKQFSRLGIGPTRKLELEKIPQELHARRQRFEEMFQSHLGETGSYESAREKLIDELTFTLFNRIAAVKVMEVASLFPPIITKQPEHGDRSFGHKAWLEVRPDMRSEELEGIRDYIHHAFNELGDTLPLYSRSYPYALLPDPISLNEIIDAFNAVEKDSQVGEHIWMSDDVLGWLYESYNNAKKAEFKDSGDKVEYDKVSLQSQVYTPLWVVQFLVDNSLGKLYLEMYPDSDIKNRYKIANAPETQERELKPLHEVKLIDPACGSGNFLLYAFDLFYELYLDQIENYGADYDEENIPQLILEHNLHGIDLDDRAVQLAQFGLYIKARKRRRNIGGLQFNVVSSDFYLPKYEDVRHIFEDGTALDRNQKALIAEVWSDLQLAYKFGSLIRLDEKIKARLRELISKREKIETQPKMFSDDDLGIKSQPVQRELFLESDIEQERIFAEIFFTNLKTAVEQYAQKQGNSFLTSKTMDAVSFLEMINTKYDVATANPPYTSRRDYGLELQSFIDKNYREPFDTYINLYACFLQRLDLLLINTGKLAMVTPMTFMFISTFEETRKLILTKYHINVFVQYGFGGMFSESVDPAMFALEKGRLNKISSFIKLDKYFSDNKKDLFAEAIQDLIIEKYNAHNYLLNQKRIFEIEAHPFIFWISQDFRDKFKQNLMGEYVKVCSGLATGQNERFLRYWWELEPFYKDTQINGWVGYAKGGAFNKWYGNLWLKLNWRNNGYDIKNFRDSNGKLRSTIRNEGFYFKEGITYSASGRGGYAFRYLPEGNVFDVGGSSIFPVKSYKNFNYLLGFLNSKLAFYIADCLNPTANIQVGDLKRVPFVVPDKENEEVVSNLAKKNNELTKKLLESKIVEPLFKNCIFSPEVNWQEAIHQFNTTKAAIQTVILINEAVINEFIFDIYSLSPEDKKLVMEKQGDNPSDYFVTIEAKLSFQETYGAMLSEASIVNIGNIPIRNNVNNIQEIISALKRNIPVEEICIKYKINPIDVWHIYANNNEISHSQAKELSLEFLADMIRDILLEDDDGIIPLVPNTGEKTLLEHIENKFRKNGYSMAQYSQFDTVLGQPLNEYINNDFFSELSDHLNMFSYLPKTPFIWHLSSGPEQGFDCFLIIYKWSRDKLMRTRSVYIEHRERALINRQTDLAGNESVDAQNEKDKIRKQLTEIDVFKRKIDELLTEGYDPILEAGVGKNIAPLQKKMMIPYEVLNKGQLERFLNADW